MDENNLTMEDLMQEIDRSMKRIHKGDKLQATVVVVQESGIVVNIGYHADGIIPWNEFSHEEVDKTTILPGQVYTVVVMKVDDGEGNVLVSKKRAEVQKVFEEVEKMYQNKEHFMVKVEQVVKGGVVTSIKGLRAFIPGSQITNTYIEDLSTYVGKTLEVEIIEWNPKAHKIVLSGKAIAKQKQEQLKQQQLSALVEGEKYQGKVTKLMPYGAFVSLGHVEGLVHNNDLAWGRVKHPSQVIKEGENVEVVVLSVDNENQKIALSLKDITPNPWDLEIVNMQMGDIVEGKITRLASFGAFVTLGEHVEGLVHISQISSKRVHKVEDVLTVGETVKVKILSIDKEAKKVALSIKAIEEEAADAEMQAFMNKQDEQKATLGEVIGEML